MDFTLRADNIVVVDDFYGISADKILIALVQQAYPVSTNANGNAVAGLYAYSTTAPNLVPKGVTGAYVQPGPTLGRVQIPYMTLTDAIVKVCRLASQQSDYSWYFDQYRNLHFFSTSQIGAPVCTFTDSAISMSSPGISTTLGTYSPDNFQYVWDAGSVRNSCIVRGSNIGTPKTDTFIGNGLTTQWALSYAIDSSVLAPTLLLSGVKINCSTLLQGATPSPGAWYVTESAWGAWVLVAPTPPRTGQTVQLTYTSVNPILTQQDNLVSQQLYADSNGPGKFQTFISDPTLTSLTSATARANGELQQYQWVQERVKFQTSESWPGHVQQGQIIQFISSRTPDSQRNYSLGVNGQFLITQCTINGKQGGYRTYTITAARVK